MNPPYAFALTIAQPLAQAVETLRAALAAEQMGIVSEVDMQATLKAKLGIDSAPQRMLGGVVVRLAQQQGLAGAGAQCGQLGWQRWGVGAAAQCQQGGQRLAA